MKSGWAPYRARHYWRTNVSLTLAEPVTFLSLTERAKTLPLDLTATLFSLPRFCLLRMISGRWFPRLQSDTLAAGAKGSCDFARDPDNAYFDMLTQQLSETVIGP